MGTGTGMNVPEPASPQRKRRRRQVAIFLFCILIAMVLWFLRALENNYETQINHPVRFTNLPDDYVLLRPLPRKITLDVEALGFSILKHNWNFSKTPLTIDFRELKPVMPRKKAGFKDTVNLSRFADPFTHALVDIKVKGVKPEKLVLEMAPRQKSN
jgi:hypothetical protein